MKYFGLIITISTLLVSAAFLTSACDGKSGDSGKKGQFVDSPVIGISYSTSSRKKGVTDAKGRFAYEIGDTIVFSIGSIEFPAGIPQDTSQGNVITPAHLAGTAEWETDASAINIIRFLLTIDQDGDAANGIQIPVQAAELAYKEIDFSDTAAFDLAADGLFKELVNESVVFEYDTIVSAADAELHFTATIKELGIEIEIQYPNGAVACNASNTAAIQGTWTGTLARSYGNPSYLGVQTIVVHNQSLTIGETGIGDSCTYQSELVSEPVEIVTDMWVWTDGADTYTMTSTDNPAATRFRVAENNNFDVSSGTIEKSN